MVTDDNYPPGRGNIMCECREKAKFHRIADDLRAAIRRGDFPPGSTLPKQVEIATTYGTAVGTVNRAIRLLQNEGLVVQQRSHGTRVRSLNPLRLPITRYPHAQPGRGPFETACAMMGWEGKTDILGVSRRPADDIVARELNVAPGSEVVCRENRMRIVAPAREAKVVQLQTTWLPLWVAEGTPLDQPPGIKGGIYCGLEECGHIPAFATETVSPRMPTREEYLMLGLRPGSPVSDVRRTTFTAHRVPLVHTHLVVTEHVSLVYPQQL